MAKSALADALKKKKKKKEAESDNEKSTKLISKGGSLKKANKSKYSELAKTGLISKGYSAVKQNQKRIEEAREQAGKRLFRMWLPDGETKVLRFINEEPLTYMEHRVQPPGQKRPQFYTCIGEDCPLCAVADGRRISKARFVGAYLVIDRDEFTYKQGPRKGETVKDQPRLFVEGQQTLSQLQIHSEKKGLTNRDYEITRTDKSRTIIADDKSPLSKKDKKTIKELLKRHEVDTVDELLMQQIELQTFTAEELKEKIGFSLDDDDDDDLVSSKLRNF